MVPKMCTLIIISSVEIPTVPLYSSGSLPIKGGTIHSKEKSFFTRLPKYMRLLPTYVSDDVITLNLFYMLPEMVSDRVMSTPKTSK